MEKNCDVCGKKLGPGDKVIQTFTLEQYNFDVDMESFTTTDEDKKIFACEDCCENMNFREKHWDD